MIRISLFLIFFLSFFFFSFALSIFQKKKVFSVACHLFFSTSALRFLFFFRKKKSEKKRGRKAGTLCGCYAFARSNKNPKKAQRNRRPHKHRRKGFFFYNSKKKKNLSLRFPCGLQYSRFFSPQKRKKKRIRAFAKLQLKLWLNKNWTQLTTVTRIGFFQPGKEVNSN